MFEMKRNVGHSVIGLDGRMRLSSVVDFMQDCCMHHNESIKPLDELFRETDSGMYVAYRQIAIKRLPEYNENVSVRTWVCGTRSMFAYRNTGIYGEDGELLVLSSAVGVFAHLTSGKPFRIPPDVEKAIVCEPSIDTGYLQRKIKVPESDMEAAGCVTVMNYHCDNYGHMNNARYFDIACEYLPDGFVPARVRIEYILPVKPGEKINIYKSEDGELFVMRFAGEEDETRALIEFLS